MDPHPGTLDIDEVQRLIDDGIRVGPAGLAARAAQFDAADEAARRAGEPVTVTLEAADPLTGEITRVHAPTWAQAQALLDAAAEQDIH